MLVPKRVKHRKQQRGHMKGRAKGGTEVTFGEFGLASARTVMDHEPSDRSGSYRNDSLHQTWR